MNILYYNVLLVLYIEDFVAKATSNSSDWPVLKLNHEKVSC